MQFNLKRDSLQGKTDLKSIGFLNFFVWKINFFNAFIYRPKSFTTKPEEKAETNADAGAMDIESGLKLPAYTDTEIIMDDESISSIDFMSRFEKFKVDEISIDEAEDDICFNAKECFEDSNTDKSCVI